MTLFFYIPAFHCVSQIGGVKAKVLAAHRAGISRVILPRRNEKDLHEVPVNIKVNTYGL